MEYISLHGYIGNTSSDTEVLAERTPAEHGQEYLTSGKEMGNHAKLGRTKELGRETGMLVGLDLPSVRGGTEAGVRSPQQGNCLSQRRNI